MHMNFDLPELNLNSLYRKQLLDRDGDTPL